MFCNFPFAFDFTFSSGFVSLPKLGYKPRLFAWPHYYWMQVCVGIVGRFVEPQRQLVTGSRYSCIFEVDKWVRLHGSATALCDRFCRVLVARCN